MSGKRMRIPVVTAASLVLGAMACGDGDSDGNQGGSAGTDVSLSRQTRVARQFCASALSCGEDGADNFSQAECEEYYASYFEEVEEQSSSKKCFDLFLDYMDCYADVECDENFNDVCAEELEALDEDCEPFDEDSYTASLVTSKRRKAR